ncbi:hypothetical protein ACTWQF_28930 [Streptomyces sp. 8N114]|uniref:hypothetical protein n=1 Tax=Streptomyces sp. 8N114 TaxID=3457419 RepID=UPI003FD254D0
MTVTAHDAIEALRELERRLPDVFTLEPGATDAELTAAEPSLPDDIRAVLRATTGIRMGKYDQLVLDPGRNAIGSEWSWGPGETARVILQLATGDTFFVDRDPGTGAWGAVFSQSADFFNTWVYCARSLPEFLVDYARDALANAESEADDFDIRFPCESVWDQDVKATGTPVAELRGTDDADLAAAISGLSDEAILADLRGLEPPVKMDMQDEGDFERHGTERLFAVVLPDS